MAATEVAVAAGAACNLAGIPHPSWMMINECEMNERARMPLSAAVPRSCMHTQTVMTGEREAVGESDNEKGERGAGESE